MVTRVKGEQLCLRVIFRGLRFNVSQSLTALQFFAQNYLLLAANKVLKIYWKQSGAVRKLWQSLFKLDTSVAHFFPRCFEDSILVQLLQCSARRDVSWASKPGRDNCLRLSHASCAPWQGGCLRLFSAACTWCFKLLHLNKHCNKWSSSGVRRWNFEQTATSRVKHLPSLSICCGST